MESKDNHDRELDEALFADDPQRFTRMYVARHGFPPIAGAEAEPGADSGAAVAEAPAEGAETPPADEASGEDPSPELDEVFRLEDVPDEIREPVGLLQKQLQSALTRARQADREELVAAREAMELVSRLDDPEQQAEALEELAEKMGYEPVPPDERDTQEPERTLDPEIEERLAKVDELSKAEEERKHQQRIEIVRDHVNAGLDEMADGGKVSDDVRELYTLAALAHRGDDGLPNTERAGEIVGAVQAEAIKAFLDGKRGEDAAPDASGSTGIPQGDTSTQEGRLALAQKIAARHLG